jgi:hypothetical protein
MFSNIQCHSEPFATCHSEPFPSCHSDPEPFVSCHPEQSEGSRNTQGRLSEGEESNSAQDKLREESLRFFVAPISSGLLRMTLLNALEH